MDDVEFIWWVDAPALDAKAGDSQRIPQAQAERYATASYGAIVAEQQPEDTTTEADEDEDEDADTMRVRLLEDHGGQLWTEDGPVWDAKRGDIIRLSKIEGLRMIASGQAIRKLKGKLPRKIGPDTAEALEAAQHPALVEYLQSQQPPKAVAVGGIYDPSPVNFRKTRYY